MGWERVTFTFSPLPTAFGYVVVVVGMRVPWSLCIINICGCWGKRVYMFEHLIRLASMLVNATGRKRANRVE